MTDKTMRDKLVRAANLLKDLTIVVTAMAEEFGDVIIERSEPEPEPSLSLEDVRKVMAEISRAGKTAEMKALLSKFGATKLSDVDPAQYAALIAAAEEISHA